MTFPFNVVYDHIAKPLCKTGLHKETLDPYMAIVEVQDNKVTNVKQLPSENINPFFMKGNSKQGLANFIRLALTGIGDHPFCIVLITEAFIKVMETKNRKDLPEYKQGQLAEDPESEEAVFINIYRPEGSACGFLKIKKDR